MSINCSKCGAPAVPNASHCESCGSALAASVQDEKVTSNVATISGRNKIINFALFVILALCGLELLAWISIIILDVVNIAQHTTAKVMNPIPRFYGAWISPPIFFTLLWMRLKRRWWVGLIIGIAVTLLLLMTGIFIINTVLNAHH